jgi:phospholipase C
MMENRSFDHLMGWLPNADGQQSGLTYKDNLGIAHQTYPLAPDYTGCGHPDPDHSYSGGRVQYNGGAMDGFRRSGSNDDFAIGYYVESDQPFFAAFARNYTTLDRYFCSFLGPTFPNRIFMNAAQTDRISNTAALATVPTIWDRLAARQISGRYYYSNVPFLGLWGSKYQSISRPYAEFLIDAAAGNLPAVSFVDPRYTIFDDGTGNDDHPHADIRAGDSFLAEAFRAVSTGPGWRRTVFIVTFDEWGGFFEHVAPPRAAAPNDVDHDIVGGKTLLGFRVPVVIASPFTRGDALDPRVNSLVFDHTSVLKLIEWRWGLAPLTARDASDDIQNLALALDFDRRDARVPALPQPPPPPPMPCPGGGIAFEPNPA